MTEYQFLVTNGEKQRANQAARSHAMRNALQVRSDGLPTGVHTPSQVSQKTTRFKRSLNGKFRLGAEKTRVKAGRRSGPTKKTGQEHEIILHSPVGLDVYYATSQYNEQTNALFKYCLDHFQTHERAPGQEKFHLAFSMSDPLIMASTLAMTGMYCTLDGKITDASIELEGWRQKGQAIQKISRYLRPGERDITDAVVVSIATLVSIMNLNGVFQIANIHLNGLAEVIRARGGPETLQHSHNLARAVTWADIHVAAGLGRRPIFQLFKHPWENSIPSELLIEAQSGCFTQLRSTKDSFKALLKVLTMLRTAILCQYSPCSTSISSVLMDGLIDAAEHITLRNIAEYIRQQSSSSSTVEHSVFAAAHVFIYCCFRDLPKGAKIFHVLIYRLKQSLQSIDDFLSDESDRWPILWSLFVGYAAGLRIEEHGNVYREWFLSKLQTALHATNLHDESHKDLLKQRMMEFLWVDKLCYATFEHFWHRRATTTSPCSLADAKGIPSVGWLDGTRLIDCIGGRAETNRKIYMTTKSIGLINKWK